MKTKIALLAALLAFIGAAALPAHSAPIPVTVKISWTHATLATDNKTPLTGAYAIQQTNVYHATSSIPLASTLAPTATVAFPGNTWTHSTSAEPGTKLYYRLKHKNAGGLSPFSAEVVRTIAVPVPLAPGSLGVTITIVVQ